MRKVLLVITSLVIYVVGMSVIWVGIQYVPKLPDGRSLVAIFSEPIVLVGLGISISAIAVIELARRSK